MTDNEIVIALRAVAKQYEGKPIMTFETNINAMATDAANHIERLCEENNRQKEEIKEWKRVVETWVETHEKDKTEIERLDKLAIEERKEIDRLYDYIQYTKAEARKEFVERLKDASSKISLRYSDKVVKTDYSITGERLDKLVKEMENET